jgi:hypothetical protein
MNDELALFSEVIASLRSGTIDHELSAKFREVCLAVKEHTAKGTFTVKISIAPDGEGALKMDVTPSMKKPEPSLGTSSVFVDATGRLARSDFRQHALPFKGTTINGRASDGEAGANA